MSRLLAVAVCCGIALAGCANPDIREPTAGPVTGSPGEYAAPPPRAPSSEASSAAQSKPQKTLARYASRYTNWDYRDLPALQRSLASEAVGAARASEQLAAATTGRDQTLARARVWNRGSVVSISPNLVAQGRWVVVTREQTGGDGEYEGLPSAYHVTLATVVRTSTGWAVSAWEPQN